MCPYVFISYKSQEHEEASWVRTCLQNNGIDCWMAPESIPGGTDYAAEITNAIVNCSVLVLILSERAQHSDQIPRELELAINHKKPILPFQIESCSLVEGFEYRLGNVQRYLAYLDKSHEFQKMIERILLILEQERNELYIPDINQDFSFDMNRFRTFASTGYEDTVFKCRKTNDAPLHFDINFEKNRIRETIPAYAGIYYPTDQAFDLSRKEKIIFEAGSADGSITGLWVEIKPYKKEWMHESFEFDLSSEMKTYEIPISQIKNRDTAACVGEITFVFKTSSFANQEDLRGQIDLGNLAIKAPKTE